VWKLKLLPRKKDTRPTRLGESLAKQLRLPRESFKKLRKPHVSLGKPLRSLSNRDKRQKRLNVCSKKLLKRQSATPLLRLKRILELLRRTLLVSVLKLRKLREFSRKPTLRPREKDSRLRKLSELPARRLRSLRESASKQRKPKPKGSVKRKKLRDWRKKSASVKKRRPRDSVRKKMPQLRSRVRDSRDSKRKNKRPKDSVLRNGMLNSPLRRLQLRRPQPRRRRKPLPKMAILGKMVPKSQ
jgi:hypothetical protein